MKIFKYAALKGRLYLLKEQYRNGGFSGHPEDMLGDIDAVEHQIKNLWRKS